MDKKNLKFDDTEIEKCKFYEHKSPSWINNIYINKIVVSNEVPFGNQDFKCFIGYKNAKKLNLYAYSFQEWVEILIKLNACLF